MFDLVIRNGAVVDGTGEAARRADIGIRDGRIAELGAIDATNGREVVDAEGLVVAPGFIDLHTHYDAQLFWDPLLTPSCLHGVTTVIGGNCGLTLAPVKPADKDFLTRLLARVEAIPVDTLRAGIPYGWQSYPEMLETVNKIPLGLNVGLMVGHSALRRAVMGEAASERAATADEIEAMCKLLDEALAAGGIGFSTANVSTQVDGDGRPTPPNFATREEFVALAGVCAKHPGTSLEFIPNSFLAGFSDEDMELMADMSAAANRPLNWNTPLINKAAPHLYSRQLSASDVAEKRGGKVVALYSLQNGPMQMDFDNGYVFRALPGWAWLFELSPKERIEVLADPQRRAVLQESLMAANAGLASTVRTQWGQMYVNDPRNPAMAHLDGKPIAEIARERGITDFDAACEIAAEAELKVGLVRLSYDLEDEWTDQARIQVLKDPRVVLGASDGGAHMDMMVGSDFPTRCLGELVRERGVFTMEELVRQFTDVPAQLYGLRDRGRLAPGHWADIVIFDPAKVDAGPLRTVTDLPAGGSRLMTRPVGVHHVLVAGEVLIRDGQPTDKRAGQLLRSGRDTETVFAREAEVAA
jgi:N-acyl-D-aspartate/D-glutamate deacylase